MLHLFSNKNVLQKYLQRNNIGILPEGLVPWLLEDRLTSFRFLLLICVKSSKEGSRARDETNLTSEDGVDTLDEFVGGLGAGFFLLGPRSTL